MTVLYPRAWLKINGIMLPCKSATVHNKTKRTADTFEAEFPASWAADFGMPYTFWADFQPVDVEIIFSDGQTTKSMITGEIDKPEIDWFETNISISGRDKSKDLAENKRNQKFPNSKSSKIAKDIADANGLKFSGPDTDDYAGKAYTDNTAHLVLNRSDHKVLSDLAELEGVAWYVLGDTLYFGADASSKQPYIMYFVPPIPGQPAQGNVTGLKTHRNMTAAKTHKVHVRSWHHKDKKMHNHTVTVKGVGKKTVHHRHHHHGHSANSVKKLAKSRAKNATRHDMNITVEMPGDLNVDPGTKSQLVGTYTIYDQGYDIDSISRTIEWGEGFGMSLECKGPKEGRETTDKADQDIISKDDDDEDAS